MRSIVPLALCAACSWCAPARAAAPADTAAVPFALVTPPSAFETGCFGPCSCPVQSSSTYGSFLLAPAGADPLYVHYDVRGYIASFNDGPGAVALVGSGTYRVGGEVALQQELTLDLRLYGGPTLHFDSGLVPVTVPFPALDLACAVHGFACLDTVVRVDARPVATAGVPLPAGGTGIRAAWPNPFRGSVRLLLDAAAGAVAVTVVDVAGRPVRTLSVARPGGAGTLVWDGRRDDGRPARPGLYWVRVRGSGGADARPVVKLD